MNEYTGGIIQTMLLLLVVYGISFFAWWKFLPQKRDRIKQVMIVVGILFVIFGFVGVYMISMFNKLMA